MKGKLSKVLLYAAAIAYPFYEFYVEGIQTVSYEGIGSIAFPIVVLAFQLPWSGKKIIQSTPKRVLSEFLGAAILATLAQFVYLGVQGYLNQPDEMRKMIRFDWVVLPFALIILWLLNRQSKIPSKF